MDYIPIEHVALGLVVFSNNIYYLFVYLFIWLFITLFSTVFHIILVLGCIIISRPLQSTYNQVELVTGQQTGKVCVQSAHTASTVWVAFKLKTAMKKCLIFYS